MAFDPQEVSAPGAKIKVIGVGGGGTNAVSTMIRSNIEGVEFVAANTDVQSLRFALAPRKIQIGKELTKGLGAGADPDIGRDAALEDRHELQETLVGSDMVFVTAGMGGGTGTGGASIVSQIARDSGALTVGVVTKPFSFEGKRRKKHAEIGIAKLKEQVDTLVVIPNDRLLKIATPDLSMLDAFKMADTVLVNAVRGISDIINVPGTINVDFADVKTVMSCMGQALMGIGIASGEHRAREAALKAISSPLLEDVDIEGATGILINISAGEKISLIEINEACTIIEEAAHEDANIIFGAVIDEDMNDEIRITVIATGFPTTDDDEFVVSKRAAGHHLSNTASTRPLGATHREAVNAAKNMHEDQALREQHRTPELDLLSPYENNPLQQNSLSSDPELSLNSTFETSPTFASARPESDEHLANHSTQAQERTVPKTSDTFLDNVDIDMNPTFEESGLRNETSAPLIDFNSFNSPRQNLEEIELQSNIKSEAQTSAPHLDKPEESFKTTEAQEAPFEPVTPPYTDTRSTHENDSSDFLMNSNESFTEDIDKRIDEALELAEKVRSLDKKEDDLDIPAFLRNTNKGFDLT